MLFISSAIMRKLIAEDLFYEKKNLFDHVIFYYYELFLS